MTSKCHTENYNGYFNAYVPEARVEVIQLDEIRHCLIFEHINESDSGVYAVRALNALGEAVCEAEIDVCKKTSCRLSFLFKLWYIGPERRTIYIYFSF